MILIGKCPQMVVAIPHTLKSFPSENSKGGASDMHIKYIISWICHCCMNWNLVW